MRRRDTGGEYAPETGAAGGLCGLRRAFAAVAEVMARGAATHPGDKWWEHPAAEHIAHAREHLRLLDEGDESEPHLEHAAARLLMGLEVGLRSKG